jgi:hypothetical protein
MRKAQSPTELGFTVRDVARLSKAMQQVADKRTFIRLWAVLVGCTRISYQPGCQAD